MGDEGIVYTLDEALSSLKFGKYQALVLTYAGLGWFSEAMEIMILSFVGPAVKTKWGLSAGEESLLTTAVFGGMLFGAGTWGLISDNYGRKKSMVGVAFVTSIAGLLGTFSPNYASLVVCRSLVGFGLGGGPVFFTYSLEFIPVSYRGAWMVLFSAYWSGGILFEASLAWIVMTKLSWRWLLAFSAAPSFALVLFYGLIPESPRFLCAKGRTIDAHKILEKIAFVNKTKLPPGALVSDKDIRQNVESTPLRDTVLPLSMTTKMTKKLKSGFSSFFTLFSRKLFRTTLLLWVLFFASSFSYYGVVLLTSKLSGENKCGSKVLQADESKDSSLYINVFITSLAEFPGLLFAAITVDKIGRKLSMTLMFVLACIFLLPLFFQIQSAIVVTVLLFGARMCATGTFTVATIYAPEIYPTTMRSTGAGAASAIGRIGGMVCPLVAVGLVTGCHLRIVVLLFEGVFVLAIASSLLFPFETNGKGLKDADDAVA